MVRTVAGGELSAACARRPAGIRFAIATPDDDTALRRLLRENPTRGAISLTFEREPAYFSGIEKGRVADPPSRDAWCEHEESGSETRPTEQTIVAYEDDQLVCMGRCTVRPRYLNGELHRVGYLGELRLAPGARRGLEILRGGYRLFRELQRDDPADFYFTSIAADNDRARRVLERGLPGLPRYTFLAEFVTRLIPVGRAPVSSSIEPSCASGQWPSLLAAHGSRHQLAAGWTRDALAGRGKPLAVHNGDQLVAAAVLWDQRASRQTVVRGYSRALAIARPFANLAATIAGRPHLPPVGGVVPAAFLSPLAIAPGHEARLAELVRAAFAPARARGVELLTLGFAAGDPRGEMLRRAFHGREYRSRLYQVSWSDDRATIRCDGRPFLPEVALL